MGALRCCCSSSGGGAVCAACRVLSAPGGGVRARLSRARAHCAPCARDLKGMRRGRRRQRAHLRALPRRPLMRIVALVPPRRWPRGGCCLGGGLVGVRPRRCVSARPGSRAARKPGSRQPRRQLRGGRRVRPCLAAGSPAGVGCPCLPACARVALTPATFCRRPSRARRLMGSRGSSCPGSRVLFGFFPAAASPRFSPRVGQGTQGAPRGRGVPPAAAGGGRPPHAVGRKGVLPGYIGLWDFAAYGAGSPVRAYTVDKHKVCPFRGRKHKRDYKKLVVYGII